MSDLMLNVMILVACPVLLGLFVWLYVRHKNRAVRIRAKVYLTSRELDRRWEEELRNLGSRRRP